METLSKYISPTGKILPRRYTQAVRKGAKEVGKGYKEGAHNGITSVCKGVRGMKQVEVLLVKDVPNLGKAGDVVKVKWGYAKNYLIPKGFALSATESVLKNYENIKKMKELSLQRRKRRMEKLARELSKEKLLFVLKVNEEGKPYGSVSSADIVKKLKEKGYNIDRSMVQIDSISEFGTFQIPIKLHPEVVANLKIVVEPER